MSFPSVLPFRPQRPRPGYGSLIFPFGPFGGFGFGGPCFFNGFTSVCGGNPFLFGGYWNNCFGPVNPWNCGYGYGGGFGLGYGYGYGPGYGGGDWSNYSPAPASNYSEPDANQGMDVSGEYIPNADQNAQQAPAAPEPQAPPTQIILKDGSAYEVTAYWVSGGELYYRPVTGGLNHVPLEQLDLSATVQANSRNGVTFTLTDRPPKD